jgi:hypothetical protein
VDALSVLAPTLDVLEREQITVLALPFGARAALLGSGLIAELDWLLCGQLSSILASEAAYDEDVHVLVPASPWTPFEYLMLYGHNDYARVCKALADLQKRDTAILPRQVDDESVDTLIKLGLRESQRLHILANENDAAKFRLRAGRRNNA